MKNIFKEPSIWLLIFLVGFPQVSETIYTPSLPELTDLLSTTSNKTQQTLSIYFLGFAIGVLLWGILCDKIGRRNSMLWGISIYIIGSVGCLLATNIDWLIYSRIIQAMGAAAGSIVTQTIMRDCYDDSRRPQMFAKASAVLAFSPAVGPLLGSVIAQHLGIQSVFMCLVVIGLAALTCTFIGLRETKPTTIGHQQESLIVLAKRMLTDRKIWIYGSAIGIINGIIFSYYGEAPFIFIDHLNFSVIQYGYIGIVVAIASFVGAVAGRKLLMSLHYIQVIQIGFTVILFGSVLFILASFLNTLGIAEPLGYITSVFAIMVGIGISLPSCLSNALIDYKDCLGKAGALLGLLYYLMVGGITAGISIIHTGSPLVLPIYVGILAICLLGLTLGLKRL